MNTRFSYIFISSIILLIVMLGVSMVFGAIDTTVHDVWLSITQANPTGDVLILREIRLPRELGALLVGMALSVAGAIMQGMTRNPLADPGLLGLTAGANAALALAIAFIPNMNYFGIMIACFIGAAVGAALVFGISALNPRGFNTFRIILAGAAVSAFLYAVAEGTGILFQISKDVSMWTAGAVMGTSWGQLAVLTPIVAAGILIALLLSRQLTVMSLNEEMSVGLGQNVARTKTLLFIVIILLAGGAVSLVGNLAFVGLMVPHMVRPIVGTDYRLILPMSATVGGIFMLAADTIARTINAPYETPLAAIVSVVGLPFFLYVLNKGGRAFS
ncbi:iron ABC transporter permease [Alkalibacillus almallahensis]|uniref:FecCD family ABC transporter permease n=1 Tax=Alkalibacillus almallahensis TaxID=1379154 RepID=UPI001421F73F|nr:iron complex transport system permease protein [Alkalibacillus almallahensis]